MANITSQPNSPAGWKEYASLDAVSNVPLKGAKSVDEQAGIASYRDVYLDGSSLLKTDASRVYIYADVLALTELESVLSPRSNATIQVVARVITADGPVHLNVNPPEGGSCAISLYASVVDQPISVSVGGSSQTTLELGTGTGNLGVVTVFTSGNLMTEYQNRYFIDGGADFQAGLQTQLRIALAVFWKNTGIAVSLCAHVATMTVSPQQYPLINAQAVALGQQLAVRAMTGPNTSYAPVLKISEYLDTMDSAVQAVSAFEEQYNRFQDKEQSLQDQMLAWDTMLQKAIDEKSMRENLRNTARAKYDSAQVIASNCSLQMIKDNGEVARARVAFELGLQKWKYEQTLKAVFSILSAILEFAVGIGTICVSGGAGAAAAAGVGQAVQAVQEAEQIAGQVNKILSSGTLEKLASCVDALEKLYPLIDSIVNAIKNTEMDPSATIPPTNGITGSDQGDADAAAIVALASWDKWVLESDQQMDVAVSVGIEGASDYRLALRKNAIDGKQLAQAQAQAVKAGQQYVQAQMEVILCEQDIKNLQDLHDKYEGQADIYAEAEAKFYDRFMGLRTSLAIQMQNIIWAYKYYTLQDSNVTLDSQKSAADYKQDIATIKLEMQNVESQYASDFQPFTYDISSDQLPSNYHQVLLDGLKSSEHTASFTLVPKDPSDDRPSFASQFVDGSHYRLNGMAATLRGAKAQSTQVANGVVIVVLQISTSGVYSDINGGKIFSFTSLPQVKRYSYDLRESGEIGETRDHAIYETSQHAEPTPFTQWTIKLLYPERVDLEGLTAVDFEWSGHVRFDPARRAQTA